jgi:hypothetical protein
MFIGDKNKTRYFGRRKHIVFLFLGATIKIIIFLVTKNLFNCILSNLLFPCTIKKSFINPLS